MVDGIYRFVGISELIEVPKVAVVVDVMRAFTVAAWAFARGADNIVLAASESDALALKTQHPQWLALKDGAPAAGFDGVNSPGFLQSADLAGRTLILKTTAGTVGAWDVVDAPLLLCASFVVAGATAAVLRAAVQPATFIVTGQDGCAEEDLACAQYIAERASGREVDAAGYLGRAAVSRAAGDLREGVRRGYAGIHWQDVELCLELDRFAFAMRAVRHDVMLVLQPVFSGSIV